MKKCIFGRQQSFIRTKNAEIKQSHRYSRDQNEKFQAEMKMGKREKIKL
jgi:hypothetical protein